MSGERALWLAVVDQAITDFRKYPANEEMLRLKNKAEWWLFRDRRDSVGSLSWICENLGLNITILRHCAKSMVFK